MPASSASGIATSATRQPSPAGTRNVRPRTVWRESGERSKRYQRTVPIPVAPDLYGVSSPPVLPPCLASLNFADPALGSDDVLAARVVSAARGARVLVLGGSRPRLLTALAGGGCDVVVVDSSRTELRRTREVIGATESILLLADDPREPTLPGGADVALVTSAAWRAVVLPTDRRHVLRGIAGVLRPGGRLFVEIERIPQQLPGAPSRMPTANAETMWWRDGTEPDGLFSVRVDGDEGVEVTFSAFTLEAALGELSDSGFATPEVLDPQADDLPAVDAPYVWVCARLQADDR